MGAEGIRLFKHVAPFRCPSISHVVAVPSDGIAPTCAKEAPSDGVRTNRSRIESHAQRTLLPIRLLPTLVSAFTASLYATANTFKSQS